MLAFSAGWPGGLGGRSGSEAWGGSDVGAAGLPGGGRPAGWFSGVAAKRSGGRPGSVQMCSQPAGQAHYIFILGVMTPVSTQDATFNSSFTSATHLFYITLVQKQNGLTVEATQVRLLPQNKLPTSCQKQFAGNRPRYLPTYTKTHQYRWVGGGEAAANAMIFICVGLFCLLFGSIPHTFVIVIL